MSSELASIPAWMVDSSTFVIGTEKLFTFLYPLHSAEYYARYKAAHPCIASDTKITKSEPLTGHAYMLDSTPVLTIKGAEYMCLMGVVAAMDYTRFMEFFSFVADWKRKGVPAIKDVDMYTVKLMGAGEGVKRTEYSKFAKELAESKSEKETAMKPTVPTLREVMTAVPLSDPACLPEMFKQLLNEYIDMRLKFADERERKDKLIADLIKEILSK